MEHDETTRLIRRVIGFNIRSLRMQAKLSQEKFAEMVGINRSYLSQIERGMENPSLVKLVKIADGLDEPITTLMKGLESHAPHRLPADTLYAMVKLPNQTDETRE